MRASLFLTAEPRRAQRSIVRGFSAFSAVRSKSEVNLNRYISLQSASSLQPPSVSRRRIDHDVSHFSSLISTRIPGGTALIVCDSSYDHQSGCARLSGEGRSTDDGANR